MRSHFVLFITCFLFFGLCASAKDTHTVEGTYEYIMPSNQTPEEAKVIAMERAKLEALAQAFGTNISQTNSTLISDENTQSKTSFYSLGESEVRGEWVETIAEKVEEMLVGGQHIFKVWVKGEAREIKFAKVEFEIRLLRNGKDDKYQAVDNQFYDGDDFYVSFCSPSNGYLVIYLLDHARNGNRIIPMDDKELFPVKRNERYVFVDDDMKKLILTTDRHREINQVYVIFSPKDDITPPVDNQITDDSDLIRYQNEEYPNVSHLPVIPYKKFQKWIVKLRKQNPKVQVVTDFIKISGKE